MKFIRFAFLISTLFSAFANADGYTDCTVNIDKIYYGDNGNLYIYFVGGGSMQIPSSHQDQNEALSIAMSAFVAKKKVVIRSWTPNFPTCNNGFQDFRGIFLTNY